MKRRSIIIGAFILLSCSVQAQEQKTILQLADEAYGREEYAVAGALYQRLADRQGNKLPADRWTKLARSYQEIAQYVAAAAVYRQMLDKGQVLPAAHFGYAEVLRQLERYDSARVQYEAFTTANADSLQLRTIGLQGCDSAAVWSKQSSDVRIAPFSTFNTTGSDIVNMAGADSIIVMSTGYRPNIEETHERADKRVQQPYYKTYLYQPYSSANPTLYQDELEPSLLRKFDYHVGPVCFSKGGDTLYATINIQGKEGVRGVREQQVWQSIKNGAQWSPLSLLTGINVAGYRSSHAILSPSGDVLYFISNRPGGRGQTDIWYSEKQADGSWGPAKNCGTINTVAEEAFPVMQPDGTLYFSSKGHAGLGGYDLYRATGSRENWSGIQNLKAPLNSGADELSFVLKPGMEGGYFSSNRGGGVGSDDVYAFTYLQTATGVITAAPMAPAVRTARPAGGAIVTPRVHTAAEESDRSQLESMELYYDFNSSVLLASSREMLDRAASLLQQHGDWKLQINSYTDSRGSSGYNDALSASRSISVINYLAGKGIDARRLYYSNRGEHDLVNGCADGVDCPDAEHRKNRRSKLLVRW